MMKRIRWFAALFTAVASVAAAQAAYTWTDVTPVNPTFPQPTIIEVDHVVAHPLDPRRLAVHRTYGSILLTADGGSTWNAPASSGFQYVETLSGHPGLPGTLFVQVAGILPFPTSAGYP